MDTPNDTNQRQSVAWTEGHKAGEERLAPECPYPTTSTEFGEWMNGYVFGMNTFIRCRP